MSHSNDSPIYPRMVIPLKTVEEKREAYQRELESYRTHVLDWQQRMNAYAFTVAPDGVLPKKKPKRVKTLTQAQSKTVYDYTHKGAGHKGMSRNSRPSAARAMALENEEKAVKRGLFDELFAGEEQPCTP